MPRLKLYLTYDGSSYNGWQRQTNTRHTIQEILETKLSIICNERVKITASGRTDAGVHARIQVAHVTVPERTMRLFREPSPVLGEPRLKQALNRMLPDNIRLLHVEHVPDEFHAIRDVRRKTYVYFIDPNPVQWPELRRYAWNLRLPLDWAAIEAATPALVGRQDFKGFCGKGSKVKTTVRTIYEAKWGTVRWQGISGQVELRALRLTGSGFLKQMVRSVVGTLIHIGNQKAPSSQVARILETGERALSGPTAPPNGLWLWDILY